MRPSKAALLASALVGTASVCYAGPPHVLSDTPSAWLAHKTTADLAAFFSADMDLLPPNNTTSPSTQCSGRGTRDPDGACGCRGGYSGDTCQYAGPSWLARVPQPGLAPKSRAHHTLTKVGERLYLFGGAAFVNGRAHRLNDLHYYTPSTRRWTTPYAEGHWPAHRSGHSTTLVTDSAGDGARLIVFGGIDGDGAMSSAVDVYEVEAQRWRRPAIYRAPPPRARHAAVALGGSASGSVWIFGGAVRPPPPSQEAAAKLARGAATGPRHHAAARPPAVGSAQLLDDVHVLDATAEPPVWFTPQTGGGEKPMARCGHSATLMADELSVVVFGGDGGAAPDLDGDDDLAQASAAAAIASTGKTSTTSGKPRLLLNDVWVFSFTAAWRRIQTRGAAPPGRAMHTAHRYGDYLAVTGGIMAPSTAAAAANAVGGASPAVTALRIHVLHLESWEWRELRPRGEPVTARFGHASVLLPSALLFVGGIATAGGLEPYGGLRGAASSEGTIIDGITELKIPGDCADNCNGGGCALGACLCGPDRGGLGCALACEAGWGGYLCTEPTCKCGAHGTCGELPGVCACEAGWGGATCDTPICAVPCAPHGHCAAPGSCECAAGWSGLTCEVPSCPAACGEHGTCEAAGSCACDDGWSGPACTTPICIAGCASHGACVAPGVCACSPGWHGEACTQRLCPAGSNGAVCSKHGSCTVEGCACEAGWQGRTCETPRCEHDCFMRGACVAPSACACVPGWRGALCEQPVRPAPSTAFHELLFHVASSLPSPVFLSAGVRLQLLLSWRVHLSRRVRVLGRLGRLRLL